MERVTSGVEMTMAQLPDGNDHWPGCSMIRALFDS